MGFNIMFDILFLHSKYVYLLFFKCWKMCIKSWKRYVCRKCFGCMNEEWVFEQFLGFFVPYGRARFWGIFWLVFVFYFKLHTDTLKLERRDLVTFVFWFEKSPRKCKSWNCFHGFVLGVHGFVLGVNGFDLCCLFFGW